MTWKRHTLLDISNAGREIIFEEMVGGYCDNEPFRVALSEVLLPAKAGGRIPGIVRREELNPRQGFIPVGFSSPQTSQQGRLRIAAFTRTDDVVRATSPYELLNLEFSGRTRCLQALEALKTIADCRGLSVGVWGSVAMELYTGLPYTHDRSDLDLLVAVARREELLSFMVEVSALEAHFGLRIDVELDLPNGYGVALKELFGSGRSILGKGIEDVVLMSRSEVFALLPQEN